MSEPCSVQPPDNEIEAKFAELRQQLVRAEEDAVAARAALAAREKQWEEDRAVTMKELHGCAGMLAGMRHMIHLATVPMIGVDRMGLVIDCNRKATEVMRCEAHASKRRSLADWLHKADRAAFGEFEAAALRAAGKGEHPWSSRHQRSFRLRCHGDGEQWHEVLFSASPRFSAGPDMGAISDGVLYILQDVSEPRKRQVEAELAVEDLTRHLTNINAPIIGVDLQGIVDEWNAKAEMLTGFPREEAVGKSMVKNFITAEFADSVQLMLSQGLLGQEITNYEFSLFTKAGQRREILWSATARRNRKNEVVGVIGVGQDITELRSESKMLANYVRICGAAVWSLRGNAMTGVVTDSKTKEIEHLISQQAQMDVCDPRMVLWRASFVSILKTMCQNFWMRRKSAQGGDKEASSGSERGDKNPERSPVSTDFGYEFCFEAPNGSVKWYKVQGHLIQECHTGSQFEVNGSMQEVTSMLIDKVMGDRWQKWWNRMCHMVFDATLLVDTQEYRVLNAWGEEKVFGCKLQSHHPLLHLIKPEDTVSLKEAFNEVTFKGFERGRTLHLLRPGCDEDMPAQCFLLSADQENPNECMMGIRMQESDNVSVLWDVAKPNPVLTLEDLARWKSGLKRSHRRPSRRLPVHRNPTLRSRPSDPGGMHTSSHSLSSIPEDLHGEFEEDDQRGSSDRGRPSDSGSDRDAGSESRDSVAEDTDSLRSSSKSSTSMSSKSSNKDSEVGVCNSSPARSAIEEPQAAPSRGFSGMGDASLSPKLIGARSPAAMAAWIPAASRCGPQKAGLPLTQRPDWRQAKPASLRVGPPLLKLRWSGRTFDLNLDDFLGFGVFSGHIFELTGVPPNRQTLIVAGRRLPVDDSGEHTPGELKWISFKADIRPNQALMMVGRVPSEIVESSSASPAASPSPNSVQEGTPPGNSTGGGGGSGTSEATPPPDADAKGDLEVQDI